MGICKLCCMFVKVNIIKNVSMNTCPESLFNIQ